MPSLSTYSMQIRFLNKKISCEEILLKSSWQQCCWCCVTFSKADEKKPFQNLMFCHMCWRLSQTDTNTVFNPVFPQQSCFCLLRRPLLHHWKVTHNLRQRPAESCKKNGTGVMSANNFIHNLEYKQNINKRRETCKLTCPNENKKQ
jgi:hypothetical protein